MQLDRRHFVRLGAGASMAGLLGFAAQEKKNPIKIGMSFTPNPREEDLAMLRHNGIDAVSIWAPSDIATAEWMIAIKKKLEANGTEVYNIGPIDLHCDPTIILAMKDQDLHIEKYKRHIENLGRASIHYNTYAHIANIKDQKVPGFYATSMIQDQRRAETREFDWEAAKKLPLSFDREYREEEIWASFTKFIRAIMPVAEKWKVKIGLHPDDPPVPSLGGVPRIFRNIDGYKRAFEIAASPLFGACLCVGTWGEGGKMMGMTPVEAVRYFGKLGKLFKIHFRNVDQPLPKFHETFVDNGYMDMGAVMKALKDVKFNGIVIPDHVPGGGYAQVNYAYTLGYMKALRDRV